VVPSRVRFCEVESGCPKVEESGISELGIKDKLFEVGNSGGVDKQMQWQDSDILIIKGAVIIIRVPREVVGFIGGTWLVDKFEVEFSQLWKVVGNVATDFLGVAVIFQVQVVCKDVNLMRGSHQEMMPSE
jgi:hypothetical protein